MENLISGLAYFPNFSVNGQLITWNGFNIPAHNISFFSVGVSSTYYREPEGLIAKALIGAMSAICVLDQIESDDAENLMDTLSAFYNLCIKEERLPCLNLQLNNGGVLEITFTDLWTFRKCVKDVKEVCSHFMGIGNILVKDGYVQVEQVMTDGNANFIELNFNETTFEEEKTMNINSVKGKNITFNEFNLNVVKEELAQRIQALQSQSDVDPKVKDALQDFEKGLETEKPGAAKAAAFRLLENIGSGALANVLGSGLLESIQKLAEM